MTKYTYIIVCGIAYYVTTINGPNGYRMALLVLLFMLISAQALGNSPTIHVRLVIMFMRRNTSNFISPKGKILILSDCVTEYYGNLMV